MTLRKNSHEYYEMVSANAATMRAETIAEYTEPFDPKIHQRYPDAMENGVWFNVGDRFVGPGALNEQSGRCSACSVSFSVGEPVVVYESNDPFSNCVCHPKCVRGGGSLNNTKFLSGRARNRR